MTLRIWSCNVLLAKLTIEGDRSAGQCDLTASVVVHNPPICRLDEEERGVGALFVLRLIDFIELASPEHRVS